MKRNKFLLPVVLAMLCVLIVIVVINLTASPAVRPEDDEDNQEKLSYPEAHRVDQTDIYHGVEVADPYRWLEDMDSPETRDWVKAQAKLFESYVGESPLRQAIKQRILVIREYDRYLTPDKKGDRWFYARRPAGKSQWTIHMQSSPQQDGIEILNPHQLFEGDRRLGWYAPSPNGRFLAFWSGEGQTRWQQVQILDIDKQELLDEVLTGHNSGASTLAWTHDEAGFFYIRFDLPETGKETMANIKNPRLLYHKLGTPQSQDRLVFQKPEREKWLYSARVSEDGRYLIIEGVQGAGSFSGLMDEIYVKDLRTDGDFVQILTSVASKKVFEGNDGSTLFIRTTLDAPRNRIVAVNLDKSSEKWVEVIPESEAAITNVVTTGERFIIRYNKDAKPEARIFGFDGALQHNIKLPDIGSMGGMRDQRDGSKAYYSFGGLYDPVSIYELDLESGRSQLYRRPELAFDPDDFETKQVFYHSEDGARIPMFISHKKGIELDGDNPLFMYAYGAFGWAAFPWFQPHIITWMELGGVYALPNIRGGGEYGDAWAEAGRVLNKPNGIDDYIAAAEWLIENNYTNSELLVANGGSASGVLAGAALTRRPDLFGASIIDIPALDMLRFTKFTGGSYWTSEYGSPDNPQEFKVLYSYSPYHNLKAGACYPPTLVMAGEKDESTVPLHAYKFIARLQHVQDCNDPVLLKMMWGAGHNYGATPEQVAESWSDAWAFLIEAMALEPDVPGFKRP